MGFRMVGMGIRCVGMGLMDVRGMGMRLMRMR